MCDLFNPKKVNIGSTVDQNKNRVYFMVKMAIFCFDECQSQW